MAAREASLLDGETFVNETDTRQVSVAPIVMIEETVGVAPDFGNYTNSAFFFLFLG